MQDIIERTFSEWVRGLDDVEARVNIFNNIRDIPYHIDPGLFDIATGPVKMLEFNAGACISKHNLLGTMFEELGLEVKYCSYGFRWKDLDIDYDDNTREQLEKLPVTYHLACKALINRRWVLVDATWDKGLMNTGIPVNSDWDGASDTLLAVKPLSEAEYNNALDRDRDTTKKISDYALPEKLALSRFSLEFNKWLERSRL